MASVAESVGDAAETILAALALSGVTVKQRRQPGLRESETPTTCVVTVNEQSIEPATADDTAAWFVTYTLTAVLTTRRNTLQTYADTIREYRQRMRRAITQPALTAAGVAEADDVDPVPRPTFDPGLLPQDVDYSVVQWVVRCLEPR